eukprot:1159944-Pelagomonas_calceolata.AAC.3
MAQLHNFKASRPSFFGLGLVSATRLRLHPKADGIETVRGSKSQVKQPANTIWAQQQLVPRQVNLQYLFLLSDGEERPHFPCRTIANAA